MSMIMNPYRYAVAGGGAAGDTTWDSAAKDASITLSNSDLSFVGTVNAWRAVRGKGAKSTGKWRFEVSIDAFNASSYSWIIGLGLTTMPTNTYVGANTSGWGIWARDNGLVNAQKRHNNLGTNIGEAGEVGDVVGIYYDADAGKIWAWTTDIGYAGGGDPAAGTSPTWTVTAGTALVPAASAYNATSGTLNAGQTAFASPSAAGFNGWTQ